MLSELHSLNLKLCNKQCNKKLVLHLIVVTQLSNGWQHNYSIKTRKVGQANEQCMYSLMSLRRLFIVMLSVVMLSVIILSGIMLTVMEQIKCMACS
jgi:hypothetical protein